MNVILTSKGFENKSVLQKFLKKREIFMQKFLKKREIFM